MRFHSVVRVVCLTALLAELACGDNHNAHPGDSDVAPRDLRYAQPEIVAAPGVAITPDLPTVTGTVTAWSVNPALPEGLGLAANGVIAGTPVAASPRATYTVTASNRAGSTDATVEITVRAADACRDIPALPAAYTTWPALEPAITPDADMEAQIAGIVAKMTLAQKVGQMVQGEIAGTSPADVSQYFLGSMLNGGGSWPAGDRRATAQAWRTMADAYFDASPSVDGVKIRIRTSASGDVGGSTNTVSERFISRAIACMSRSVRSRASVKTASWLPASGASVKTSAMT